MLCVNFKPSKEVMEKLRCGVPNITKKTTRENPLSMSTFLIESDSLFTFWSIGHQQNVPNYNTISPKEFQVVQPYGLEDMTFEGIEIVMVTD